MVQEYLNETGASPDSLALTPAQLVECVEIRNGREISSTAFRYRQE